MVTCSQQIREVRSLEKVKGGLATSINIPDNSLQRNSS